MVLPFTLLELGILGAVLYYLWKKRDDVEIISIADGEIHVEQRGHRGNRKWAVSDYWATVVLEPAKHRNHPSRLLLRSHGKDREVGRCLTDEERAKLARDLRHAIREQHHRSGPASV